MKIVSFVLFSCVTTARSDNETAFNAHAAYQSVQELNYGVNAYECDGDMQKLSDENKQRRRMASSYRVCFEPNDIAKEAGVGIKELTSWEWRMGYDDDVVQEAMSDGEATSGLSQFECTDGGRLCVFDSLLKTEFYDWDDSVRGYGAVSFTAGIGSLPTQFHLFLRQLIFDFNLRNNDDGTFEIINNFKAGEDEKEDHEQSTEAEENDESIKEGDFEIVDEAKEEL